MGVLIVISFKDYSTKIMKNSFEFIKINIIDEKLYDPTSTKKHKKKKI